MNSKTFRLSMLCTIFVMLGVFVGKIAHADSENRIRINASTNTTHGTILAYDSSVGISLEYSRKILDHLEFGVSGTDVFFASNANLYSFSFNPAFYQDVEALHFYIGPSVGGIVRREDTGGVNFNTSALGLGGFAGIDFGLTEHFLINASVHYLTTLDEPTLSILSFGAGIGFRF